MKNTLGLVVLLYLTLIPFSSNAEPGAALSGIKIIRSVEIQIRDIFDSPQPDSFERTANGLKINTKPRVLRRELLFKEGDSYDEFLIKESERNLRRLKYLRDVLIESKVDGQFVDIVVKARDTWTLIPSISYSAGAGQNNKKSAGLSESNLLGVGTRIEALYADDSRRTSFSTVFDDDRFLGGEESLVAAAFMRNDGDRGIVSYGKPFRTLLDKESWLIDTDLGNTVGRLFKDGSESYIFRQRNYDVGGTYTLSRGNPEAEVRRYSFGWRYIYDKFRTANAKDYDDLNLDPAEVSNDPAMLPEDRRYSGPVVGFESITPDFVAMNYIDRFDRVEDYNLGLQYAASLQGAAEVLDSLRNAALVSGSIGNGIQFSRGSFLRGELGLGTRVENGGLENTLVRAEAKYFDVLGCLNVGDLSLGRHTLAMSGFVDFGDNFDRDRQLTAGGDNLVRGYDFRAFNGDKRVGLNIEDRMHFIENYYDVISVGGAVFFDAGGATYDPMPDLLGDQLYADVGVGLRIAFPASVGQRIVRLEVALPLRDGPEGTKSGEPRFLLSGGQIFSAKLRSEVVGSEHASVDIGFDR